MLRRKISADQYTELPAHQVEHYTEADDGSYALEIIGADGQLEQPEDVSGLKSAYEKSKEEVARLKEQHREERAAHESGDGAVFKLRQRQFEESEQRLAQIAADGQAALAARDAAHGPKFAERSVKLNAARSEWDKAVLDCGLAKVIRDAGGAVELLQGKLEKFCVVEHDSETDAARIVVVDDNGIRRDDPVTRQPISAAHALEELRLFDPRLQAAFTNGNGNGNGGGG